MKVGARLDDDPLTGLQALLDGEQGVVRALLGQLGVNPAQVLKAAEEGLNSLPKVTGGEATLSPELTHDQITDSFAGPSIGLIPSSTFGLGQIIVRPIRDKRVQSTLDECQRICNSYLLDQHSASARGECPRSH